jgi:hypothetical protein
MFRYGIAGQARFVGVWCGAARTGSLGQVRRGSLWFVVATSGMEGFVKAGGVRRRKVALGVVRQVWFSRDGLG